MSRLRKLTIPWTTIFADTNAADGEFNPCTPWIPAGDVQLVRMTFEVRNTTDSDGVVKPAYETANVENSPGGGTLFPASSPARNDQTGNGMSYPNGLSDIGASTLGKQLVRFGVFFDPSVDTTLKMARFSAVVEWEDCG